MWMQVNIGEKERGLVMRDGQAVGWLSPGQHSLWRGWSKVRVERVDITGGVTALTPELNCVVPENEGERLSVGANEVALVSIDGVPGACLGAGRYLVWRLRHEVEVERVEMTGLTTTISERFWGMTPAGWLKEVIVRPWQKALVIVNGRLEAILEAGRYGVHARDRVVEVTLVDLREQELQITGQEIITADKVSLRVNLIVRYRVIDALRSVQGTSNLSNTLYSQAQMAARRFIGHVTVDELLEGRQEASKALLEVLQGQARAWGVELLQIDLKDVILPGDMKAILNRVIEAEKQAAANLILRREETAATRSLANTAKMLQSNPTLMRLKELEALKDIAGRIDQVTLVVGQQELRGLLGS